MHEINLSHNEIVGVEFSSFENLHSLSRIDLNNNRLENLNEFSLLRDLKTLNLSKNSLKDLDPKLFQNLTSLDTLDLSYNLLETIYRTLLLV